MNDQIRRERHLVFPYLFDDIIEPVVLLHQSVPCVLIEVESPFAITNMFVEPPSEWLDFRVPRIYRIVAMTVVAGSLKNRLDCLRHGKMMSDGD
jgi:hypothetical protein